MRVFLSMVGLLYLDLETMSYAVIAVVESYRLGLDTAWDTVVSYEYEL